MKNAIAKMVGTLGFLALASGCSMGDASADLNATKNPSAPVDESSTVTTPGQGGIGGEGGGGGGGAAGACSEGKKYIGFGGTELHAGRLDNELGTDRLRIKPFSALSAEYTRVLGAKPGLVDQSAATFGNDPDRWYTEAQLSAVSVYQAYRIAFQGCLNLTANPAEFKTAPSNSTAATQCATWGRKFWSRTPSQPEVDACVKVAMVDSLKEGENATTTTPQRRWAYTCASLLASAGFLTF